MRRDYAKTFTALATTSPEIAIEITESMRRPHNREQPGKQAPQTAFKDSERAR
jgi:hypothetical protein